jgi:iron complex outermembrane receptor protein
MTRRMTWLRGSASGLALGIGLMAFAHAQAQTNGNAPPANAQGQNNGAPVVTVTAERRTVNLQTAPIAATVLSGGQLTQRGVYNIDQLQFMSPSLTVTNYGIGEDFNIRGVGKSEENIQTPSGIVVYRDGVATFPGFFTGEPYYDIANVEILRGPQGTIAGQNASGGAIFITETDPSFSGTNGWIEGQFGDYNDVRVRGFLNAPLSDTFAVRIAADAERENSFYKVTGPHTGGDPGQLKEFSGRVSLLWQPTTSLRIEFKNDYTYVDTGGVPNSPVPIPAAAPYPTYASAANLFNLANNIHNLSVANWDRSVLNVGYTFADGIVLKSITGFQIGRAAANQDIDGTAIESDNFSVIGREQIWSEELNLISPNTGPLKWVAGAYYQDDDVRIPFGIPGFDIHEVPLDILLDYHTPKTTEAVFGTLTYDVTDQLQLQAGARYTHSAFALTDVTSLLLFGLPGSLFGLAPEHAHLVLNDDKVTWNVALNWKVDPNNLLYVSVATGHKPGGINTTPLPFGAGLKTVVPFQPEDLTDYEIGWKTTQFDGHLRAQLDAFYTDYTNHQLTFASAGFGVASQPGQSIIRNIPGTSVHYGVEAQAQAVFGPWSFDASIDYLYTRLGSVAGSCLSAPVSLSCAGGPFGPNEFIGGNQDTFAPSWNVDLGGQYVFHLGDGSTLTPRIDYSYIAAQWASPFQGRDPNEALAAAQLDRYVFHFAPINLMNLQLTWAKGRYNVSLYGTNVLDDHYFYEGVGFTVLGPAIAPTFRALREAAAPAQFGVRVSTTF